MILTCKNLSKLKSIFFDIYILPAPINTGNKTSHFNTPISVIETVQQITSNSQSKTDAFQARAATRNVERCLAHITLTICFKSSQYKNLVNLSRHKRFSS